MQIKEENLLGEVYTISDKLKMEKDKRDRSLSEFEGTSDVENVKDLIKGSYGTTEGENFYASPLVSKAVEENGSSVEAPVSVNTPNKSDEQMSGSSFHQEEKAEEKRVEIISAGIQNPSEESETSCEMNNVEKNTSIPLTVRGDVSSEKYKTEGADAEAIKSPGDANDEKVVKDENDYNGDRNIFISPNSECQRGEDEKKETGDGEGARNVLFNSFVDVVEETRSDYAESDTSGKHGDNSIEKVNQDVADHPEVEQKTEELEIEEKPIIEEKTKEPIVTEKHAGSAVEEKPEEPAVEVKTEEPVVQEKPEETEVQEKFERTMVEEKPEELVVEETPKEPTREKTSKELEFEEKPEKVTFLEKVKDQALAQSLSIVLVMYV